MHKEEKKLRKEIIALEDDEFKIKFLKEKAEKMKKEDLDLIDALNKKKQLIESLREKAKQRHEQMSIQKHKIQDTSLLISKPRYVEIEQKFKNNFELPELERRKAELAKKRILFQPISRQEWMSHLKRYNECMLEAERKRLTKANEGSVENSQIIQNSLKRAQVMESQERILQKKNMVEKRKKYAEVVRESFAPKIDHRTENHDILSPKKLEKQHVAEIISEKEATKPVLEEKAAQIKVVKVIKKKPKKKMESKTPEVLNEAKNDYLAERRQKRTQIEDVASIDSALNGFDKLVLSEDRGKMLRKLKKYENLVKLQEQKIKETDLDSAAGLQLEEKMNELLMQSIKAKMSMLDQ